MPSLKKILVPVDYSDCSRKALEYAVFLAERFKAEVEVVHVAEVPPHVGEHTVVKSGTGETQLLSDMLKSQAKKVQDEFMAPFAGAPATIRARMVEGRPATAILDLAGSGEYDLIVMGTHGRSGFERLIIGSVAERVVRSAPCPVVVVRQPDADE